MSDETPNKGSSSAVAVIIVVAVLGVLVVGGLGAGFLFYVQARQERSYAMMAQEEAEERAQRAWYGDLEKTKGGGPFGDDTSATEAQRFFRKVREGDFAGAHELTSRNYQRRQNLDQFRQFLGSHPALSGQVDLSEPEEVGQNGTMSFHVTLTGKDGAKTTATIEVIQEDGFYRVDRLTVP